jgi:hypothetical protein
VGNYQPWNETPMLPPEFAELQAPPRDVSFGLRCRLLAGPVVLTGAGIFSFCMPFVVLLGPGDKGSILILLLLPVIALLVAAGGFYAGRRKLRLLCQGTLTLARMTLCITVGEDSEEIPVAEFRRQMAAIRLPGMNAFLTFAKGYLLFWRISLIGILVFGVITLVGGLIFLGFMLTKSTEALPMLFAFLGFGAVWVTVGAFMLKAGGLGPFSKPPEGCWQTECVFEIMPQDGGPVRVKGRGTIHPDLAEEPAQPALYDPANPNRAALLSGIAPDLAVTESGGWTASHGWVAIVRLAAVILLIAGPILGWVLLPPIVR